MLFYSDEEYSQYLQDASWTREDTDLLFRLCKEYDLRFIIIHDRFQDQSPSAQFRRTEVRLLQDPESSVYGRVEQQQKKEEEEEEGEEAGQRARGSRRRRRRGSDDGMMVDDAPEEEEEEQNSSQAVSSSSSSSSSALLENTAAERGVLEARPIQVGQVLPAISSAALSYKSIEDLKQRFYSIQRILLTLRNGNDNSESSPSSLLVFFFFFFISYLEFSLSLPSLSTECMIVKSHFFFFSSV